ncbi:hypothetical protein [Mannheimia indoligenes]|uniref:Uncharacterized protein n=1 Tax=Mannheimia indoligenes TaxID=3103145 RepID=A0ABU7ZFJ4_9PAST
MRNLRKLAILAIGLGTSVSAFADFITAWEVSDTQECGVQYCRCTYDADGLIFTINIKSGYCPLSIQIDPETGRWRR